MNARQTAILDLLAEAQRIRVRDLAARFAVSEMTIRRDLASLERQGFLVRTHGGGVAVGTIRFLQNVFSHLTTSPRKRAIGKLAAGLVQPRQTILFDAGTTTLEVARHLLQDASITVATPSLCVAQELYDSPIHVLLLGGYLRKEFPSLFGPPAERMLSDLHVDVLFIGCDGASSEEGFFTSDLHLSSLEKAMIRAADRVVVVTESVKFGRRSFVRFATPQEVHTVVTDTGLSPEDRNNLEERGVKILLAAEE